MWEDVFDMLVEAEEAAWKFASEVCKEGDGESFEAVYKTKLKIAFISLEKTLIESAKKNFLKE